MAKQSLFLEEWLKLHSGVKIVISQQVTPAQSIIKAWANLRESLQNSSFTPHNLQDLHTLINSQSSLYVADPQVKLIITILTSPNLNLPTNSYPLFLKLIYIWTRKSSKHSSSILETLGPLLNQISNKFQTNKTLNFMSEFILLLGSISYIPSIHENLQKTSLNLLITLLSNNEILSEDQIANILAGIGYSLSSSSITHFPLILHTLSVISSKNEGYFRNLSYSLMILHLFEWIISNLFISNNNKINLLKIEIFEKINPDFLILMIGSGILRYINRFHSNKFTDFKALIEEKFEIISKNLISKIEFSNISKNDSFLLKCISLALAKSGPVSYSSSLLLCVTYTLLFEIFSLNKIYVELNLKEHINSVIFKESGTITRILCDMYVLSDKKTRNIIENMIYEFCEEVYIKHRRVKLMGLKKIDEVEKIMESGFLMVVMFCYGVIKMKESEKGILVKVLVMFSCVEYFRRVRLGEYIDTIRSVVKSVKEDEEIWRFFVESMPCYDDLIKNNDCKDYKWYKDEVQTARILFYLRVIPTSSQYLPVTTCKKIVAPIMFLYLNHPNEKVSRASHTMFVSLLSSGKDDQLKEQLVFYYMHRSLEGYPEITPYEGLASGVATLVKQLPAGNPAIFYSIHSLIEKSKALYGGLKDSPVNNLWNSDDEVEELTPLKKLLNLITQLLSLVDIQVLPSLMKQYAELITELPLDGQNMVLDELHQHVAESDDVTRKPTLVSWVQSLSYLCSERVKRELNMVSDNNTSLLSLNRIYARL